MRQTKAATYAQVKAYVKPELRLAMKFALLHRGTDFSKWLEGAMQQYVDETKTMTHQTLERNRHAG